MSKKEEMTGQHREMGTLQTWKSLRPNKNVELKPTFLQRMKNERTQGDNQQRVYINSDQVEVLNCYLCVLVLVL